LHHRFSDSCEAFGATVLQKSCQPSEVQRVVLDLGAYNSANFVFNPVEKLGLEPLWFPAVCRQFGNFCDLAKSETVFHPCISQPD